MINDISFFQTAQDFFKNYSMMSSKNRNDLFFKEQRTEILNLCNINYFYNNEYLLLQIFINMQLKGEKMKVKASLCFFSRFFCSFARFKNCDEIVFKLVCPLKIPNNNIDRLGNIMNNTNNLTCMKLGWQRYLRVPLKFQIFFYINFTQNITYKILLCKINSLKLSMIY